MLFRSPVDGESDELARKNEELRRRLKRRVHFDFAKATVPTILEGVARVAEMRVRIDRRTAASLEDVIDFFQRWYGPNNATLVIAGDIELDETRRLVDYWFGEIPRGADVPTPGPRPANLQDSRSLMWEDNFATLPELQIVFPTVEQYHADEYALDALAQLLAGSRVAPQAIVPRHRELLRRRRLMQAQNS